MSPAQAQRRFIKHCCRALGDDGWLILNYHKVPDESGNLFRELVRQFPCLLYFRSRSNNTVIYGCRQPFYPWPLDVPYLKELEQRLPVGWRKLMKKLTLVEGYELAFTRRGDDFPHHAGAVQKRFPLLLIQLRVQNPLDAVAANDSRQAQADITYAQETIHPQADRQGVLGILDNAFDDLGGRQGDGVVGHPLVLEHVKPRPRGFFRQGIASRRRIGSPRLRRSSRRTDCPRAHRACTREYHRNGCAALGKQLAEARGIDQGTHATT